MSRLLFYRTVSLLAKRLPRRTVYALARRGALWAYRHNGNARAAATANLRTVLAYRNLPCDEAGLQTLVRRNFELFARYVVDFFRVGQLDARTAGRMVTVEHAEHLETCRALNRGIIGLTAHLGNWEAGASILATRGLVVNAVVRQQSSAKLDALFQSHRVARGVHVLPLRGAARAVLSHLKRNEFVALLGDLDFSGDEHRVPFFGKPARLPRGPARLAARSGAPILPGFVLRQADDSFLLRLEPPIVPGPSSSMDDIQKRICGVLEEAIGNHPDQWFAYQPLWG